VGSSHIELENYITPGRVEHAYGLAIENQHRRNQNFADTGYRAAIARDDKLLKVLELSANIIDKVQEDQMGRTMRSPDCTHVESKGTTAVHLWKEAYRLCDEGNPIRNFEWIYGAAAWMCGYSS
jgi:hypothetical protein